MHTLSAMFGIAALASLPCDPSNAGPRELVAEYETAARLSVPGMGFSAARGAMFFKDTHGGEWTCSTCHTAVPTAVGRHARTGKSIAPLAPVRNPDRFTDAARTEKWFRRNCNDVIGRECTPQEKGDVLTWLLSLQ